MNYFIWIFLALFVIILTLYIFFYIKNLGIPKTVFSFLLIPFASAFFTSILFERYPDSLRIIQTQILAAFFSEAAMLLQLKNEKSLRPLALFSYLLILAVWVNLYRPVIYLIRIPSWFPVIFTILMTALFAAFCIFTKTKKFLTLIFLALSFFTGSYLLFTALVELLFNHRLYSLLLTIGSITTLLQLLIYASDLHLVAEKYSQLIYESAYTMSFAVISAAGLLMII